VGHVVVGEPLIGELEGADEGEQLIGLAVEGLEYGEQVEGFEVFGL